MKYKIRRGDTLIGLAKKHHIDLGKLMRANPGVDARNLQLGQEVELPGVVLSQEQQVKPPALPKTDNRPIEPVTFAEFSKVLSDVEAEFSMPAGLLASLAFVESSGNPFAGSNKGAKGLFQFTPVFLQDKKVKGTVSGAGDLARAPRAVAVYITHAYNRLLQEPGELREKYTGAGWSRDWELALIAYIAGLTGTLRWLRAGAPPEGLGGVKKNSLEYPVKIATIASRHGKNAVNLLQPGWTKAFRPKA